MGGIDFRWNQPIPWIAKEALGGDRTLLFMANEAKRLMEVYQKENVKNIAGKVGFGSNPQYFSQVFKRYTGLTPTEYMEGRRLP